MLGFIRGPVAITVAARKVAIVFAAIAKDFETSKRYWNSLKQMVSVAGNGWADSTMVVMLPACFHRHSLSKKRRKQQNYYSTEYTFLNHNVLNKSLSTLH